MRSCVSMRNVVVLASLFATLYAPASNATVVISGDSTPLTDSLGADVDVYPTAVNVGISGPGNLVVDNGNLLSAGPVTVGVTAGGNGTASISGGGTLESTSNNFDNFYVGSQPGSSGNVTVSGIGTSVVTKGTDNTTQIGFSGTGETTFEGGATLSTLQLEIGRFGDGKFTARGDATEIVVSNDHGDFGSFNGEAGFVRFGRQGNSRAEFWLQDGAKLIVRNSDGGGQAGPFIQLAREVDANGLMVVEDPNTRVEIVDAFAVDPGNRAAFGGPTLQAGRNGDGTVIIRNQAEVLLNGVQSLVQVGRGVNGIASGGQKGELLITNGGKLFVDGGGGGATLNLGQNESGIGHVLVSGENSLISVEGTEPGQGPFFFDRAAIIVGGQGTGDFRIEDDAQVMVNGGSAVGAVHVGLFEGGDGNLLVKGAKSKLTVKGDTFSILNIGATFPPPMESGKGTVTLSEGGTIEAETVQFGNSDSILMGNGNVVSHVLHTNGRVAPGLSTGTMTITGAYDMFGSIPPTGPPLVPVLEIEIGGPIVDLEHDLLEVLGDAQLFSGIIQFDFINGFAPTAGDTFTFLTATNLNSYSMGPVSTQISGLQAGFQYTIDSQLGLNGYLRLVALSNGVALPPAAAPEPTTLWMALVGMLLLLQVRRIARREDVRPR